MFIDAINKNGYNVHMILVPTAEFRNNLSQFLQKVRKGVKVVITDHGQPVAELIPYGSGKHQFLEERLLHLSKDGVISCDFQAKLLTDTVTRIRFKGKTSATKLVSQLRDDD